MPLSLQAGLWGLLSGSALVLGAAIGAFVALPQRAIAAVMAFGAGVLISALSFDLMDEAYRQGGIASTALSFLAGAVVTRRRTCSCCARASGTMVPEAFETAHEYAGLITVAGFLAAFALSRVVGV